MKRILLRKLLIILLLFQITYVALTYLYHMRFRVKDVIIDYHKAQYDAYIYSDYIDLSNFLDMNNEENIIEQKAFDMDIFRRKYIQEMNYDYFYKFRYPINYDFYKIAFNLTMNKATVKVVIHGINESYPPFITFGENTFVLRRINDEWRIDSHVHENKKSYYFNELYDINKDSQILKEEIDKEFNN